MESFNWAKSIKSFTQKKHGFWSGLKPMKNKKKQIPNPKTQRNQVPNQKPACFFCVFGFGFESIPITQTQRPKDTKKTSTKPKPINPKICGFKKKSEKIYSLKYLNINKIFLKPKNFWVFGFGFGAVFFQVQTKTQT